jgi:hypothetical protein
MSDDQERAGGLGPGRPIREGEHRTDAGSGRKVTGEAREAPDDETPPSASEPSRGGHEGGRPRAVGPAGQAPREGVPPAGRE